MAKENLFGIGTKYILIALLVFTILSKVEDFVGAAKWAHFLIDEWNELVTRFFKSIFWFLPRLSSLDANVLAILFLVIGCALRTAEPNIRNRRLAPHIVNVIITIALLVSFNIKLSHSFIVEFMSAHYSVFQNRLDELDGTLEQQLAKVNDYQRRVDQVRSLGRLNEQQKKELSEVQEMINQNHEGIIQSIDKSKQERKGIVTELDVASKMAKVSSANPGYMYSIFDVVARLLERAFNNSTATTISLYWCVFMLVATPFCVIYIIHRLVGVSYDFARMNRQLWLAIFVVGVVIVISHVPDLLAGMQLPTGKHD